MRQHLPTGYDIYLSPTGWKPVPLILWYLVLASSQQSYATITVPRTTSAVTQSIGLQPMQWRWIATFIKLRKFLIIDGVHTENTEGYGGPQADEGGERKLKRINRELKEMGPQADGGGNKFRLMMIDC